MVFVLRILLSIYEKTVCAFNVGLSFIDLLSIYVAADVPELLSTGLVHMYILKPSSNRSVFKLSFLTKR